MAVNGKQKGNSFERVIARFLTEEFGDEFYRTAHSGAYTGLSNSFRRKAMSEETQKAFVGDVLAPEGYKVVIECKAYANLTGGFNGVISGKSKGLSGWLDEVIFDSELKVPYMLFFKINALGTYVVIPEIFFQSIGKELENKKISHSIYFHKPEDRDEIIKHFVINLDFFSDLKDYIKVIICKDAHEKQPSNV